MRSLNECKKRIKECEYNEERCRREGNPKLEGYYRGKKEEIERNKKLIKNEITNKI